MKSQITLLILSLVLAGFVVPSQTFAQENATENAPAAETVAPSPDGVVGAAKKIKFHYKLSVDGQQVESSEGREPLEYTHGSGQIIPGLEKEMAGLKVGDSKKVTVTPKDGYGEVLEEGFREVPKTSFPADFKFEPNLVVEMQTEDGQTIPAVIWEVKDEVVKLNFNHPLAGKTLEFDVTIVSVENVV